MVHTVICLRLPIVDEIDIDEYYEEDVHNDYEGIWIRNDYCFKLFAFYVFIIIYRITILSVKLD